MTPVHCNKLYVFNVTPRTTTQMLCKEIQKGTLKTLKINQNGTLTHRKIRKSNPQKNKKKKTNKKKERRNIKQKN